MHKTGQQLLKATSNTNTQLFAQFDIDYPTKNQVFSSHFNNVQGDLKLHFLEAATIDAIDIGFKGDVRSRKKYTDYEFSEHEYKIRLDILFHYAERVFDRVNCTVPAEFTASIPFNYFFPSNLVDLPSSCNSFGSGGNSYANITIRYELFARIRYHTKRFTQVKVVDFLVPLKFQGNTTAAPCLIPFTDSVLDSSEIGLGIFNNQGESIPRSNSTISHSESDSMSSDCGSSAATSPLNYDKEMETSSVLSFPSELISFSGDHILTPSLKIADLGGIASDTNYASHNWSGYTEYSNSTEGSISYYPVIIGHSFTFPSKLKQYLPCPELDGLIRNTNSATVKKLFNKKTISVQAKDVALNMELVLPTEINVTSFKISDIPMTIECPTPFHMYDLHYNGMSTRLGNFQIDKVKVELVQRLNIMHFEQIVTVPIYTEVFHSKPSFDVNDFEYDSLKKCYVLNTTLGQFITDGRPLHELLKGPIMPTMSLPDYVFSCTSSTIKVQVRLSTKLKHEIDYTKVYEFKNNAQVNCEFNPQDIDYYNNLNSGSNKSVAFTYKRKFSFNTDMERSNPKRYTGAHVMCSSPKHTFNIGNKSRGVVYTNLLFNQNDLVVHQSKLKDHSASTTTLGLGKSVEKKNDSNCNNDCSKENIIKSSIQSPTDTEYNARFSYMTSRSQLNTYNYSNLLACDDFNKNNENPVEQLYPRLVNKKSIIGKMTASRCNYYSEFCYDVGDSYDTSLTNNDIECVNNGNDIGGLINVGSSNSNGNGVGVRRRASVSKLKKDSSVADLGGSIGFKV